ncbi:MAG TPA: M23 family metallopeptidase, partial [Rectinemataceae bacterium]|nr:M23 family metallopeptidase [Rectinemataceae bacterium]
IAADDGLVRAISEGELSFTFEEGSHPAGLPTALGSFVVVEHPHDMAAVYSHLAPGSISSYLKTVKSDSILGKTGSSGWTEGPGLLLQIFDRRLDQWVNPLLVLPPTVDTKPPVIKSMALVRGTKTYVLGDTASVPQGSYLITADVADPADSPWTAGPLAPLSIRLAVDGAEMAKEVFDVAEGKDGRLRLFSANPKDFAAYRTKDGRYALGERLLSRGKVVFEVSAEDENGNRRTASWSVMVE